MKTCKRCYNKIPDNATECPQCKMKVLPEQSPVSQKKKKIKTSEVVLMLAVLGAFVGMLVIASVSQNAPTLGSTRGSSAGAGSSKASVAKAGSANEQEAQPTDEAKETEEAELEPGIYTLSMRGAPIYLARRKQDIQAVMNGADEEDIAQMQSEGRLAVLPEGTQVALVDKPEGAAFVDVADKDDTRGYVDPAALNEQVESE